MGKDAYYFSHDTNARNDIKIQAMLSKYGFEGYGIFWAIVEMLAEASNYELPLADYFFMALQRTFNGCSTDVQRFINDCITTFNLFESDEKLFWSNSLKTRMAMKEKRREQAREAGLKSAQKRGLSTDVQRPFNVRSTTVQQGKERKGKERKEKERVEALIAPRGECQNVILSDYDYRRLDDRFDDIDTVIDNLSIYMSEKNTTYKSHYLTLIKWAKKDGLEKKPAVIEDRPKFASEEQRQQQIQQINKILNRGKDLYDSI